MRYSLVFALAALPGCAGDAAEVDSSQYFPDSGGAPLALDAAVDAELPFDASPDAAQLSSDGGSGTDSAANDSGLVLPPAIPDECVGHYSGYVTTTQSIASPVSPQCTVDADCHHYELNWQCPNGAMFNACGILGLTEFTDEVARFQTDYLERMCDHIPANCKYDFNICVKNPTLRCAGSSCEVVL